MSALTPRDAAAAVAMCLLRTEGEAKVTSMAFSTTFEVCAKDRGEVKDPKSQNLVCIRIDCLQQTVLRAPAWALVRREAAGRGPACERLLNARCFHAIIRSCR